MKWISFAFYPDIVKLNIVDIFKLLLGKRLKDSGCEVVLWKIPKDVKRRMKIEGRIE